MIVAAIILVNMFIAILTNAYERVDEKEKKRCVFAVQQWREEGGLGNGGF